MFRNSWDDILKEEVEKEYFKDMCDVLRKEYAQYTVYPPKQLVFRALYENAYEDVKVLILGQDPYHGKGQACGLAFSVPEGINIPPSLRNIYKELSMDKGVAIPRTGDLSSWSEHGVMLLNATLTVRAGEANSHSQIGWQRFTDSIISALSKRQEPLVFILWGNYAKSKEVLIDKSRHLILKGSHPSPYSANNGFFGGQYFSKAEAFIHEEVFL